MKCPCLQNAAVPLCRGDADAMRVPTAAQLMQQCLAIGYRRCALFHGLLEALRREPGQWPERVRERTAGERRPRKGALPEGTSFQAR